jgi:3-hydroxyisobutyrate dehydrogenase-like beta-hydroxyacid dehydrogenase
MNDPIGFIGLGNIGLPASTNLIRSGLVVHGFSKNNLDRFAATGGKLAASSAEVAARSRVILQSLPSVAALEDVVHGREGILQTLQPGTVVIELSTYPLAVKRRLADSLNAKGGKLLDCELSGMPAMVAERRCVIFISGDADLAKEMQPLLSRIAHKVAYVGPLGASLKMKVVNNLLGALNLAAAAEVLALAERAGLDVALAADLLNAGGSSSAMLGVRGRRMAERKYDQGDGSLESFQKYLHMASELAKEMDANTPLFNATLPLYQQALDRRRSDDIAAVYESLRN